MGIFDADFWLGRGPGQSQVQMEGYNPNQAYFEQTPQGRALQQQLMAASQGMGPSAAQQQLQWGLGQANQAAASQARSMAGVNPATALRMQQQVMSQNAANTQAQAAALRAQEQAQARGMLANWLQQNRSALMGLEQMRGQQHMGAQQLQLQQDLYNQQARQKKGMLGSVLGVAGTLAGAALGGPAGAAAGGQLGSSFGDAAGGGDPYADGSWI